MKRPYKHLLMGAIVSNLLGAISQSTSAAAAGTEDDSKLEEVIVTGSSIRGIAPIGSAPVQYGREDIESDSPSNIGDALANIPQIASFGTEQQLSTTNRFRTSGFIPVIHNMEIGSTLTLFNGHRMAPVGAEATFADPSMIPTIALERVEVVADGNSAIYGSDAVAGVVNFLYRRDVNGFEVDVSTLQDPDTSYENRNYSALWGKTFASGHVVVAYEHAEHTAALIGEIPRTSTADHRSRGGLDRRTTTCNDPVVNVGGVNYGGPARAAYTGANPYRCDPDLDLPIGFNYERDSVLATASLDVTQGVEIWAEFNYSDYSEPRVQNWQAVNVTVPNTSPYFWVPPGGTTATSQTVSRDSDALFGLRQQNATDEIKALTVGATIDVSTEWKADLRAHYSTTDDFWDALTPDAANLRSLTASGQFNPYGSNSPAVLSQILNGYGTRNWGSQTLTEFEVKADGPLFAIAGGDVKAAIGVNHRTEGLEQLQEAGCRSCSFFLVQRDDDKSRAVNSAFFELAAPLVSDSNAKSGIQELMLSAAGRYDKYEKLDGEFTPKLGFTYKPVRSLSIFGSWGKSFAAPNIGLTTQTFAIVQPGNTINGVSGWNIYNLGGGNEFLEAETAKTYSFGVDWKPDFLDGFSAGATYYNVQYNNIIYKPGRPEVVFDPAFRSARIVGNEATPTVPVTIPQSIMDPIIAQYPPDTILGPTQTFNLVHRSYAINMHRRNFAGIDLNMHYDFDTRIGQWGLGINANKQLTRETQIAPGAATVDYIGTSVAPQWQARFQAQWAANTLPLRLTWVANYLSSYDNTATNWCCGVDSQLVHNLTAAYELEKLFNGVTLQARIANVTNTATPFADANQGVSIGYDTANHTPYGRQYTLSARAKF